MRGQKHGPRTDDLQRDDRAIYHRRRWERTERSETTSASRTFRIPEPMRSEMQSWSRAVYKASSVTWKYLSGRCGTKAAIRHITHKLQYVPFLQRATLWNYRGGERCFPPFAKFMPYRKSCALTQARQPSNPHSVWRATSPHFPRFPPLEVCVRRPRCAPLHLHGAGIRKPSQKRTNADVVGLSVKCNSGHDCVSPDDNQPSGPKWKRPPTEAAS